METNRDQMHAAGGSFLAGQLQRESAAQKPALDSGRKQQSLTQVEDYRLKDWLVKREWSHGETPKQVFEHAKNELGIASLTYNHVHYRIDEMREILPIPKSPPLAGEERLARVEKGLAIFARFVLYGEVQAAGRAWLDDFLTETGL